MTKGKLLYEDEICKMWLADDGNYVFEGFYPTGGTRTVREGQGRRRDASGYMVLPRAGELDLDWLQAILSGTEVGEREQSSIAPGTRPLACRG